MKTLTAFERQHRALMFRAERNHNEIEMQFHRDACDAAISLMRAGQTDATELWLQYPADPTPHDGPSQPVDTGADVSPEDYTSDGTWDVDKINDGDDSTPNRVITVYGDDDVI